MTSRTSSTQTSVTQQNVANATNVDLLLRLPSSINANVVKDAIAEFGAIFIRYEEWNDTLSVKLHSEGVKIFEDLGALCSGRETIQVSTIQNFANNHFSQLKNHLRSDLDEAPLTRPMLDGGWVWEAEVLNFAKAFSPISPFTERPFAETPHHFAAEIIDWINSFSFSTQTSSSQRLSSTSSTNPTVSFSVEIPGEISQIYMTMRRTQYLMVQQMALARKNERCSLALAERATQLDRRAEQLIPMMRERIRAGVQQAERYGAAMTQALQNQVETYNQIRRSENQSLQSRLDLREQQVSSLSYTRDRLEISVARLEHRNTQNEAEIHNLRGELAHSINKANNGGGGGGCTLL